MSHFYGTVKGARGEASRCGTKQSGLQTYTASWRGAVVVTAYYNKGRDEDWVRVALTTWRGSGVQPSRVLYEGPIGRYIPR